MKKALLIAVIVGGCFTSLNCTKKGDDPTPPVVVPTNKNPTTNNPKRDSVTFSIKNGQKVYKFVSLDTLYHGTYFRAYLNSGSLTYMFATKPTTSFSYSFGTGTVPYAVQIIHSSFDAWDATSGVVNIDVNTSKITFSFTDVIFTNRIDKTTRICSGYLSTYKWN